MPEGGNIPPRRIAAARTRINAALRQIDHDDSALADLMESLAQQVEDFAIDRAGQ